MDVTKSEVPRSRTRNVVEREEKNIRSDLGWETCQVVGKFRKLRSGCSSRDRRRSKGQESGFLWE